VIKDLKDQARPLTSVVAVLVVYVCGAGSSYQPVGHGRVEQCGSSGHESWQIVIIALRRISPIHACFLFVQAS